MSRGANDESKETNETMPPIRRTVTTATEPGKLCESFIREQEAIAAVGSSVALLGLSTAIDTIRSSSWILSFPHPCGNLCARWNDLTGNAHFTSRLELKETEYY